MLKDKIVPVAIVSLLTFITLSTSVMALSKIFGSFGQEGVKGGDPVKEKVADQKGDALIELTPTDTQKISTSTITQSPSAIPTQIIPNSCIVTVFGQQYDVTTLRRTHSGGDVFACGTDMTTTYQNQHGTNTSLIAPYLVTGAGITNSPQNGQVTGRRSRRIEDDED